MPKKVTRPMKSAMVKLFNCPRHHGRIHETTGNALVRKGYAVRMGPPRPFMPGAWYMLTQAGIRYNQTGKLIGG